MSIFILLSFILFGSVDILKISMNYLAKRTNLTKVTQEE